MDESKLPPEGSQPSWQGTYLPGSPDAEAPAALIPLKLVLQPGGLAVELLRPDMVFGRHSGVDVRLPLPDVSRRHCRFVYVNHSWQVFDLDSLNGVFVNGERVRQAVLQNGDTIGIGGFTFAVEWNSSKLPVSDAAA